MKHTIRFLTAILVFILSISACISDANGRTLTADNAGQTIDMNVGDIINIELEGNPSTGYTWEVAEMDKTVLKPVGDTEFETANDLVGASGVLILRFEAISTGETPLILVYQRPWEQDIPPEEKFEVRLVVK